MTFHQRRMQIRRANLLQRIFAGAMVSLLVAAAIGGLIARYA